MLPHCGHVILKENKLCLFLQSLFSFAVLSAHNQETAVPFFAPGGASYMKLRPFLTRSSPISNLNKKDRVWGVTHRRVTLVLLTHKKINLQHETVIVTGGFFLLIWITKVEYQKNLRDQSTLLYAPLCTKNHTFQSQQLKCNSVSTGLQKTNVCVNHTYFYTTLSAVLCHVMYFEIN